ncbi:MAG: DUF58 domain-containing protein [Gammaproteobacteria bacterium]|nr:DUF58 domain-containing protein [Gammaproteobacteria bacterium]
MNRPRPADYGIAVHVDELVRLRPPLAIAGFAPAGPVRTHMFGNYRSGFRGRGMEFAESRIYQPGDDIRAIDWRLTARSGRTHTKLFHEERERPVMVLVDSRAMMRFGSRDCFKSVLAARAAALLGWVALDGGDRIGGLLLAANGLRTLAPQRSRSQLLQLLQQLALATQSDALASNQTSEPTLAEALSRLNQLARPGSLLFVISDFHDLDGLAVTELRRLARRHTVTNLLVHDALELQAPANGHYQLSDGATVATFDGFDPKQRVAYRRPFAARQQLLQQLGQQQRMALLPLRTGDEVQQILQPQLASLSRPTRGKP